MPIPIVVSIVADFIADVLSEKHGLLTLPVIDFWLKKVLLPPPLGNFADIVYLKEQSFLIQMRDVCTLYAGA